MQEVIMKANGDITAEAVWSIVMVEWTIIMISDYL